MFKREPSAADKLIQRIFEDLDNMPSFTKSVDDINKNLFNLVKRLDLLILSLTVIFLFQLVTTFLVKPTFELKQDNRVLYRVTRQ